MGTTKTQYGMFEVTSERKGGGLTGTTVWYVQRGDDSARRRKIGDGKTGKKNARALAAALAAAGQTDLSALPPEFGPTKHHQLHGDDGDEWEQWAGETQAVPAEVAAAGKAPLAAWVKVVHRERESWIGNRLDVSESTVRQYLSDLREGRR